MASKDTIFLHIGMNKTATTSIQASLQDYDDGVTRYARLLGWPNHSVPMITAFCTAPEKHHHHVRRGTDAAAVARMGAQVRAALEADLTGPGRTLVLSGEGMTTMKPPEIARMQTFLTPHARQIRVIAYVRDPISFASSNFQQRISGGHNRFDVPSPNYRKRFKKFLAAFGAVEFIRFAPDQFRNHCIVTDFCDRTGMDITRVNKRQTNTSLSAEVVALLLNWNRTGVKSQGSDAHQRARSQMIVALRRQFPGRFRLHPDLIAATLDPADSAWMERQAGFALADPATDAEPATKPGGIRGEDDLTALLEATLPGLRALLTAHGLPASDPTPAALMDRYYLSLHQTELAMLGRSF